MSHECSNAAQYMQKHQLEYPVLLMDNKLKRLYLVHLARARVNLHQQLYLLCE